MENAGAKKKGVIVFEKRVFRGGRGNQIKTEGEDQGLKKIHLIVSPRSAWLTIEGVRGNYMKGPTATAGLKSWGGGKRKRHGGGQEQKKADRFGKKNPGCFRQRGWGWEEKATRKWRKKRWREVCG